MSPAVDPEGSACATAVVVHGERERHWRGVKCGWSDAEVCDPASMCPHPVPVQQESTLGPRGSEALGERALGRWITGAPRKR